MRLPTNRLIIKSRSVFWTLDRVLNMPLDSQLATHRLVELQHNSKITQLGVRNSKIAMLAFHRHATRKLNFRVTNTIGLSSHEQLCLSGLRFERYFSHHRAT